MKNNEKIRSGENQLTPYRSGRFYSIDNEWYFSVRETDDQGPFSSKLSAEKSLNTYLSDFEHFNAKKMDINKNNFKLV